MLTLTLISDFKTSNTVLSVIGNYDVRSILYMRKPTIKIKSLVQDNMSLNLSQLTPEPASSTSVLVGFMQNTELPGTLESET